MAAHQELPQAKGVEKFLNKIGMLIVPPSRTYVFPHHLSDADFHREGDVQDSLAPPPGQQTVVDTLAEPVKALMDTSGITETIQKGVNTFMETVPILMKALDEVAKIHPFISGKSSLLLWMWGA